MATGSDRSSNSETRTNNKIQCPLPRPARICIGNQFQIYLFSHRERKVQVREQQRQLGNGPTLPYNLLFQTRTPGSALFHKRPRFKSGSQGP